MMGSCKVQFQCKLWEYFYDYFKVIYWFEKYGFQIMLEKIGVKNVMFEIDYLYLMCFYFGVQQYLVEILGGYDYEVCKQVFEWNVVEFYNLFF